LVVLLWKETLRYDAVMPAKKRSRMFQVIVVAGTSLTACGGTTGTGGDGGSGTPNPPVNPPGVLPDASSDATSRPDTGVDAGGTDSGVAPTDASDEALPVIR
jgi:hypothetical protein